LGLLLRAFGARAAHDLCGYGAAERGDREQRDCQQRGRPGATRHAKTSRAWGVTSGHFGERHHGVRAARFVRVEARRDERCLGVFRTRVESFGTLRHTVWPQTVRKKLSDGNGSKNEASGRAPSCRSATKKA
jgi:hypothetical protein